MSLLSSIRSTLVKDYVINGNHVNDSTDKSIDTVKRSNVGGVVTGVPFNVRLENLSFANELQISTLKACVKLICDTIASIDVEFTRTVFNQNKQVNYVYRPYFEPIINSEPNQATNAFDLKHYWVFNSILDGEGYLYLDYNESGKLENIYLLDRSSVKPVMSSDNKLFYRISKQFYNSKLVFDDLVPSRLVLRLLGYSYDGKTAISLRVHAQNLLKITFNTEEFALSYFTESKNHKGFVKHSKRLTEEDVDKIKENLNTVNLYGSNYKYGILENGMEFQQVANDGNDSQIVDPRKFQVEEICRIFLVPPHKIGHLEKSSFNSFEQLNNEFYQNTIRPIFSKIEVEIDNKLLFRRFQPEGEKTVSRFNFLELLRADTKARTDYYDTMNKIGVYSADDILLKENEPTRGGQSEMRYNRLDTSDTEQQEIKKETLQVELEIKKEELRQLKEDGQKK